MPAVATAGGLPTRLGKYEILTPLAAGGMARIYIARTTGIGSFERHVVLKLITPERANDTTAVQMFLDEARLAASLNHQNVAQVFEVGEDAGIHYLAMEYVHGQDLRALLAKAGGQGTRVPLELALTVVAGAASGLNHAHERRGADGVSLGIVHRDVSPSNLMIGYDGAVKLLDFGIAKATARSVETQSGIIKGKFAYMAPEQCRGRDVDRRSDVFSLGIILYEITTQHRCFRADSDFDTMHRIVTGDVVRPTRLLQGYPQALEAIVMKALAVDANQRYQSAHQLLEAIEAFAVTSRMSLSTMSLGRFMRETFGEHPEPWLTQHRAPQPVVPKESTISNTDGTGREPVTGRRAPTNLPSSEPHQAASTLLDLPRPHGEEPRDTDAPNAAEWNAKSYPTMQPAYASTQTLLPDAMQHATRQSAPGLHAVTSQPPMPPPAGAMPLAPPLGTQPMPPAGQFSPGSGSGSGPSHSAIPVPSTRHGYASATGMSQSELSYPRYEVPAADLVEQVQLKPNRRPLFIGVGIIAVGLAVILAMTIGNSGEEVRPAADPGSGATVIGSELAAPAIGDAGSAMAVGGELSQDIAVGSGGTVEPLDIDESISIRVISDPPGADVLIAGKVIGTTPLDTKIQKGSGQAILKVHRGGFVDQETKIDLTGDFEKTLKLEKLEKLEEPPQPQVAIPDEDPVPDPELEEPSKEPRKEPRKEPKKEPRKEPRRDPVKQPVREPVKEPVKEPKKPTCYKPGQENPFEPLPLCKS